jgi:hypothetical protein
VTPEYLLSSGQIGYNESEKVTQTFATAVRNYKAVQLLAMRRTAEKPKG